MDSRVLSFICGLLVGLIMNIVMAVKKNDKQLLCRAIVLHVTTIVLTLLFTYMPEIHKFTTDLLEFSINFIYEKAHTVL